MTPEAAKVLAKAIFVASRLSGLPGTRPDILIPFIEEYERTFTMTYDERNGSCFARWRYKWMGRWYEDGCGIAYKAPPCSMDDEPAWRYNILYTLVLAPITNLTLHGALTRTLYACPTARKYWTPMKAMPSSYSTHPRRKTSQCKIG